MQTGRTLEARNQAMMDFIEGVSIDHNPYMPGTPEHREYAIALDDLFAYEASRLFAYEEAQSDTVQEENSESTQKTQDKRRSA